MNRLLKTLFFLTLLLGACSPGISSPQPLPAADLPTLTPFHPPDLPPATEIPPEVPTDPPAVDPIPRFIATVSTPHIDPGPDGELPAISVTPESPSSVNPCGYQWAYNDLPELTAQFDAAIKSLIPNSASRASAFGENCIGNDGQVINFLAMETDYYVVVTVDTLDDYETFGNWIAQVMQVVNELSTDEIPNPKPGFVQFFIGRNLTDGFGFRVPVQQYNETAGGKTGEELLRMFYTVP